jgi:hypothetical protein
MDQKLLLIDFENVQQVDLGCLDGTCEVMIFVGASQKSVPIDLVTEAQKLGARVEWKRVDGNGKNALDFFIAFELGRIAERPVRRQCIVLSRDKGFDPLLRHLNKNGFDCRRINSMLELESATASGGDDPNYKRALEVLRKQERKSRPRRRKTLYQSIASMFQNKLEQPEVDRIVDMLFANKLVSEMNSTITYEF